MNRARTTESWTTTALSKLATLASPRGRRARLVIMIFHRVLPEPDPLLEGEEDAESFSWKMKCLSQHFNVLPLGEAAERLRSGSLPSRAVSITFDDGYRNNAEVALGILQRWGLPATFFVASGFLDGGRMFNDTVIEIARRAPGPDLDLTAAGLGRHPLAAIEDRRKLVPHLIGALKYLPPGERDDRTKQLAELARATLPDDLMMSSEQVKTLHDAGMEIGAHTVSHPILARVDLDTARSEIEQNRERLAAITGTRPTLFAYPNGRPVEDYSAEHAQLVGKLGFTAAVSTAWGAATGSSDPSQLPRIGSWDKTPARFMYRLIAASRQTDYEVAEAG